MDFIRRILAMFSVKENVDNSMINFLHEMDDDNTQRVITAHAHSTGYIVFTVFTIEEWSMVCDIAELTERNIEDIVQEISDEGNLPTITIDPKDFL